MLRSREPQFPPGWVPVAEEGGLSALGFRCARGLSQLRLGSPRALPCSLAGQGTPRRLVRRPRPDTPQSLGFTPRGPGARRLGGVGTRCWHRPKGRLCEQSHLPLPPRLWCPRLPRSRSRGAPVKLSTLSAPRVDKEAVKCTVAFQE